MPIKLVTELGACSRAHAATGDFASVEDAAPQLIDDRISEVEQDEGDDQDDRAWAQPLVDEFRAAVARGDALTIEEHRARRASEIGT